MDVALLVRVAVALVGLWYIIAVIRRRRSLEPIPPRTPRSGDEVRGRRWEGIRKKSLIGAFALLVPMGASAVLRGPMWLTTALLIGVGLCAGSYLVASVAAGWFEGRASVRR